MRTYNCICWTRDQKDIPHCKMSALMIAPMASFIGYGCPDKEAFWGRASIKNCMKDGLKLDKDSIKRINKMFEDDTLDDVDLLDVE